MLFLLHFNKLTRNVKNNYTRPLINAQMSPHPQTLMPYLIAGFACLHYLPSIFTSMFFIPIFICLSPSTNSTHFLASSLEKQTLRLLGGKKLKY